MASKAKNVRRGAEHLYVLASRVAGGDAYRIAIFRYKATSAYQDLWRNFDAAFPNRSSLNKFHGENNPKSWEGLFSQKPVGSDRGAARELIWALKTCLLSVRNLQPFVAKRKEFENSLLQDEREICLKTLNEIESEFGKSTWLAKNYFAVMQHYGLTEQRKELLAKIAKECGENVFARALIHFCSRAIESAGALNSLEKEIDQLNTSNEEFKDYIRSKFLRPNFPLISDVSGLLFFEANLSGIDLYESLISSLRSVAIDHDVPPELRSIIAKGTADLYSTTLDERLTPILIALGAKQLKRHGGVVYVDLTKIVLTENLDAESVDEMASHENNFNIADFIKNSKEKKEMPHSARSDGGVLHGVADYIRVIAAGTDEVYAAALSVFALADKFSGHAWAVHLEAHVRSELSVGSTEYPTIDDRRLMVSDVCITAFSYLCSPAPNEIPLDIYKKDKISAVIYAAHLGHDVPKNDDVQLKIDFGRAKIFGYLSLKNWEQATRSIDSRLNYADDGEVRRLKALKAALMLKLNNPLLAAKSAIDGIYEHKSAPTIYPIPAIAEALEEYDYWDQSIDIPLLYECYLSFFEKDKISNLRFSFESFQKAEGISMPQQLLEKESKYGRSRVVPYLNSVWRPEAMRQTMLYNTGAEIEQARIDVCKLLIEYDQENAQDHREELKARVRQQEITKGTTLVEQTKVYVDMAAIKRSLRARLDGAYSRYKTSMQFAPTSEGFKKIYEVAAAISEGNKQSVTQVLSKLHFLSDSDSPNETDSQFESMYSQVMAEFLNGEHGLNSYLSTRVRHGKLTNTLRKPLLDVNLITAKLEGGKGYAKNDAWDSLLSSLQHGQDVLVRDALQNFAEEFDGIIDFVNSSVIKVSLAGEDENSSADPAAFKYWSTNLERRYLQDVDRGISSFDDFISRCMDTLWEKTDENLLRLQSYLSEQVRPRIIRCFENLGDATVGIGDSVVQRALQDAIATGRLNTIQKIQEVIGWFKRGAFYDRKDYKFDFAVQVALNIVRKTMAQAKWLSDPIVHIVTPEKLMPGRTLDGMVDVFDVIISNSVIHSGVDTAKVSIDISIDNSGDKLLIKVTSGAVGYSANQDSVKRVAQLKEELGRSDSKRRAQMEGGSGFFKIWRTLNSTFYSRPSIDFGFDELSRFVTSVGFEIDRGVYESTHD